MIRWHASRIRCTRAVVVRGYERGSFAAQSPYQALMLVLTHRGKHQIQGLLAQHQLTRSDVARLRRTCARHGVRLVTTKRRGAPAVFKA